MRFIELGKIITPAKPRRAGEYDFPVLSMTMRDGLVDQADKFKKRIASADTSQYKVVERNQLVVGFPIDEGVLAFQNLYDEAIVSPAYNIWDIQNDALIDRKYLEQFLRSPGSLAFYKSKLRSTTARRRSLPNDIFLSLSVPVPPLVEQERIVKLLDEADELRKLRAQADHRSAALIPALFHEMFGDAGLHCPSVTIEEAVEQFIDYRGKTPEKSLSGVPLVTAKIVKGGRILPPNEFIPEKNYESWMRRGIPIVGDVLFTMEAPLGEVAMVEDTHIALAQRILLMRPRADILDSCYFMTALKMPCVWKQIEERATGSTVLGIRQAELRKIVMPVPPLPLQQEFAQRVGEIRELQAAQAANRQRTEHLFRSMLHRAFNQEL